jgi:methylated-DNA-[protein]-cysteine S-methyltransferase
MTPMLADYGMHATTVVYVTRVAGPLGVLHVASVEAGVCALAFDACAHGLEPRLRRAFGPFFRVEDGDPVGIARRIARYFAGELRALDDVPLAAPATPMQRRVWSLVRDVAPGDVTTYASIAQRLGMPRAQRAVGVCLASNPVPMLVPCHRVIAASGSLGSHPGGVAVKGALLRHEGARFTWPRRARRRTRPDDTVDLVAFPLALG